MSGFPCIVFCLDHSILHQSLRDIDLKYESDVQDQNLMHTIIVLGYLCAHHRSSTRVCSRTAQSRCQHFTALDIKLSRHHAVQSTSTYVIFEKDLLTFDQVLQRITAKHFKAKTRGACSKKPVDLWIVLGYV